MDARRIKGALVAAGLIASGALAGALLERAREARLDDPVRPMLGLVVPAPDAAPDAREAQDAPASTDLSRGMPWRRRGADCDWLEVEHGLSYAVPTPHGLTRIGVCNVREYTDGELLIRDGVWIHHPPGHASDDGPTLEIHTYGGSAVAGYAKARGGTGDGVLESWPALLERRLEERPGATHVHVRNYALAGATSGPQLWRLEHEGLPRAPDAVVIYLGANDLNSCSELPEPLRRPLDAYVRTGDAAHLDRLPAWFEERRSEWMARLDARRRHLSGIASELDGWLAAEDPAALDAAAEELVGPYREDPELIAALERGQSLAELARLPRYHAMLERTAGALRNRELLAALAPGASARGSRVDLDAVEASPLASLPTDVVRAAQPASNVERMVVLALARGARPVLVAQALDYADHPALPFPCDHLGLTAEDRIAYGMHALRETYREIARDHDVPFVDLPALLLESRDRPSYFIDPVHLTRAGFEVLVDALVPILEPPADDARQRDIAK